MLPDGLISDYNMLLYQVTMLVNLNSYMYTHCSIQMRQCKITGMLQISIKSKGEGGSWSGEY